MPQAGDNGAIHQNNEGYSLLYGLLSDESKVSGIFILKSADAPLKTEVSQIADACQAARKRLDEFARLDHHLAYNTPDLPLIEVHSRDLESGRDERVLLFSNGREFELQLIFTQVEAMDYSVQLCASLQQREADSDRRAFLLALQGQCRQFSDGLMKMLAVGS